MSADPRSSVQKMKDYAILIGISLLFLGFCSCCYMLDKFRWTL